MKQKLLESGGGDLTAKIVAVALLQIFAAAASADIAQAQTTAPPPQINLQQPTTAQEVAKQQSPATPKEGCQAWTTLRYPGRENNVFPSACDTLDYNWKFRQSLYDDGFLTSFELRNGFSYDLLGHNISPKPAYQGQDPQSDTLLFFETVYDLSRLGLPEGSRFVVAPELFRTNYRSGGPNALVVNELATFIPLFQDRVELQAGWMQWQNVFYGSNLGTSSATSALGPNSSLQAELGEPNDTATPGFDIRLWAPDHHLYNHFGMFRSESPGGGYQYDTARGPGLEWVVPGTGADFTDEIGYKIPRGPDSHFLWIRAGAIYNNTIYSDYSDPRKYVRGNQGFYLTGDYQITHPDSVHFARGLYVNFKTDAAAQDRNLYADDASVSLYDIGPFAGRPTDSTSIGFTYNRFSSVAVDYYRQTTHLKMPAYSTTAIASYNLNIYKGVFFVNSLSLVKNPSASHRYPVAFEWANAILLLF